MFSDASPDLFEEHVSGSAKHQSKDNEKLRVYFFEIICLLTTELFISGPVHFYGKRKNWNSLWHLV